MPVAYIFKSQYSSQKGIERLSHEAERRGHHAVTADSSEIGRWLKHNDCKEDTLVFGGGGAMRIYMEMEVERPIIKDRVAKGTNYLGLCAGGFLGSRMMNVKAKDKTGHIVDGQCGAFSLLPVEARGPLFESFLTKPFNHEASERVSLTFEEDKSHGEAYYCHGPYFERLTRRKDAFEVVATYEGGESAVVSGKFGKGQVVLSGVHSEYLPEEVHQLENDDQCKKRENTMDILMAKAGLGLRV